MKTNLKAMIALSCIISISAGVIIGYSLIPQPEPENQVKGDMDVYIAPYITNTHPCYTHAVGSCQGELTNTVVKYVIDSGDQSVHIEDEITTGDDGFFTVNIPAQKSYQISIWIGPNEGYAQFSTYADSPNCITTGHMHL